MNLLSKLQPIDYVIVAVYLLVLLYIGYKASYGRKKKDETLFLAGKSLKWYSIGFNMWGTNVGPSMLVTCASAGYASGMAFANFEWLAFIFLFLLAIVFAPRYLASKVTTMPEFMGQRYGDTTRNILAWYALVKILLSWLTLGLFAGGVLVRQILGIPMWQSVIVLVAFAGLFAFAGGLRAIARINVFQMLLLIAVSLLLTILGLYEIGGIDNLFSAVKPEQWNLFRPASDANYPWTAFALGYPVAAIAFFCTDQAMVQSVLGAKNLEQGQLGVSFIGWLKILSIPLFIIPGIICFKLAPEIANDPDIAYMTLVTKLFPAGLNGLVIVVMIAVLVGTIGSSLNALSTVFTTDIYIKKINPAATTQQVIRTGRITVIIGCIFAVITAIAVDNVRGLNLPDIFQAVLGFIAPPLAVVFLLAVFWKRTTRLAINTILSAGSAFSLGIGVLYLWIFPKDQYNWPHYLLLSFYIFAFLFITAVIISLLDRKPVRATEIDMSSIPKTSKRVWRVWIALIIVMIALYIFFNGF